MFDHLQIDDRRERWLVGCADLLLKPLGDIRGWRSATPAGPVRRVLLLRLERIGDLLMTLDALGAVRRRLPDAELHLVVGSWNAELAGLIPAVDHVETVDVPWLSRERAPTALGPLAAQTARWRRQGFDLAINFEPDIRSNALAAASGAPRRVGYVSKGGGALLTDPYRYDPCSHVAANALRLVERVLPCAGSRAGASGSRGKSEPVAWPGMAASAALRIPTTARTRAAQLMASCENQGPLVGLNPGTGRAITQWPAHRYAKVAEDLAAQTEATIVLLGSAAEQAEAEAVRRALPSRVRLLDLVGRTSLTDLAAVLTRLSVVITGDTGTMHLAAAVNTPIVAIFGISDPTRSGPLTPRSVVVHGNLWCRPCGRNRRPPSRCADGTPDCLTSVSTDDVVYATRRMLPD